MTYSDKLEMLKLVLTPPDFVSVHAHTAFVADYLGPEKLACRLKAFAGNDAYKELLRQEPFHLLTECFIIPDRSLPRKDLEAVAGRVLLKAIASGEMESVQGLVNAFELKKGEPQDLPSRREKAASYFLRIMDGEPFSSQTYEAQILELFIKTCNKDKRLPTKKFLRDSIRFMRRDEITKGRIKLPSWTRNFNRRLKDLGLSKLPRA